VSEKHRRDILERSEPTAEPVELGQPERLCLSPNCRPNGSGTIHESNGVKGTRTHAVVCYMGTQADSGKPLNAAAGLSSRTSGAMR